GFEPDEDLLNGAAPAAREKVAQPAPAVVAVERGATEPAPAATEATTHARYVGLRPAVVVLLAICAVAGGLITWKVKPRVIGSYLRLSVNAKTAGEKADEVLRKRGIDPGSYKRAVIFGNLTDSITNEFLRERVGVAKLNEIYDKEVPGAA